MHFNLGIRLSGADAFLGFTTMRQTMRCVPPMQSRGVCLHFNLSIKLRLTTTRQTMRCVPPMRSRGVCVHLMLGIRLGGADAFLGFTTRRQSMRCVPPMQSRGVCSHFNIGIRVGHRLLSGAILKGQGRHFSCHHIHTVGQITSLRTHILSDLCTRALLVTS